MPERSDVTSENWIDAPYNRLGFIRVPELTRTERISRGDGPILELPRAERNLDSFSFEFEAEKFTFPQMLESTYTDGLLVLHNGVVLYEYYADAMKPSDTHLLMSVSKSLNSTLCGVFVERGLVKPEGAVVDYIEELRGTSWEGCTVQHLLDMRAGTCWDYEDDEMKICDVSGYRTHSRRDIPTDTVSWINTIDNSHEHGGPFRYVSLESDVLGWVLERAGGGSFADLFSREIWSAIGAEFDAQIILDTACFSVVEGGVCATLRDLGRFGQVCLSGGKLSGRQLLPAKWLERLRVRDQELIDAYADAPEYDAAKPDAFYHDNWWIFDAVRGIYAGIGINGQVLLIHHPSQTVVVKFSSHPEFEDPRLFALQDAGMLALCESLGTANRQAGSR
ncbi:MAG: serine hydrolase [Deltaproteobacteria bacterium]|nr:serine hydrolase [Deltaproteobacteria bacterium]MBW2693002.1 serine hydrolase [Deltaproteobacteria bacterium]